MKTLPFKLLTGSEQERRDVVKSSFSKKDLIESLQNCKELVQIYNKLSDSLHGVISQMQLYVLDNYKKIPLEEWNKHSFLLKTKEHSLFYGNSKIDNFLSSFSIEKSKPITNIEFTLDYIDGDFSVEFNNKCWMFLESETIHYYNVVYNYLNK